MNKLKICVLFGGASSEHDVSLVSASNVIKALDKNKYDIVLLGITKGGEWFIYSGGCELLPGDKWLESNKITKAFISPDTAVHGIITAGGESIYIDAAFPVLHGKNGEDGSVQALLTLAGIPFVGCGMTSSAVCMDKELSNALADINNMPQAKWLAVTKTDYLNNADEFVLRAQKELGFPIFVKPANAGSSVGVSKATNATELVLGLENALTEDCKAVLEEFIDGWEVECAVLGNASPITGEVGQIIAGAEFYDFDAKYNNPLSQTVIPAQIPPEKQNEVKAAALKIYKAFGCRGLSRVDFFVEKKGARVLFNEINTIPGQTSISMYPKMLEAAGIQYAELIDRLIELALER
ncbi:MAG: D-alanine--D-alanine ligase [Clostridiales bacterium]|nr:D-alanine--D-alanine ligase [Clostridiales bacterium]